MSGNIQLVHINIVCSRSGAPLRNSRLVAEIVNSLPKHVEAILLGNDRNFYSESMDLCKERRIFYLEVPSGVSFSAWAQDSFLAMCEGDKGVLLASRSFDRVDDRQIPRILANHLGWECIDSSLVFEGGNIVIDENNIYVGADTIYQNARDSHDNNNAVMHRLEKESGRRVVIIGPYPQPVGHLDSILTPLGNMYLPWLTQCMVQSWLNYWKKMALKFTGYLSFTELLPRINQAHQSSVPSSHKI